MSDLVELMIGFGVALSLFGAAFFWITISNARKDRRNFPSFYRWRDGLAPPPESYWGYHKYLNWHFNALAKPRAGKIEEAAMQKWIDLD
ncbi:hypothetical protein [Candidatus Thiodictyon syntrophicum]|jgi:hypothetical protein|uniref:hypothetical protein n=1 Tax=Candidatus Thiodictyon syntrophicum TaxID=1166950 RepID=UPI0012FD96B2|nr:hypothetical protein [Candidatus Thiodictyon syntrophicum]